MLATYVVDSQLDIVAADGQTTLREALNFANAADDPDTITFASSLNGATINLDSALGELLITESLTIDASNLSFGVVINADGGTDGVVGNGDGFRVFGINGGDVTSQALKIHCPGGPK